MPSKNITIREEVYEELRSHKRANESFSDVIERLASSKRDPMDVAGAYPGLGDAIDAARREFEADMATRSDALSR